MPEIPQGVVLPYSVTFRIYHLPMSTTVGTETISKYETPDPTVILEGGILVTSLMMNRVVVG